MFKHYKEEVESNTTTQRFSIPINTGLWVQPHILYLILYFFELVLSLPSGGLYVRTACVRTKKEFTYVHPAHRQDQKTP